MLMAVRESVTTMLLKVQLRTIPAPTPTRIALQGVLSTQFVIVTFSHGLRVSNAWA